MNSNFDVNSVWDLVSYYRDSKIRFLIGKTLEHLTNTLRVDLLSYLSKMITSQLAV